MADEKTYTEDEHIGILSERVRRETADLTAERDQLAGTVTELQNKLDVAESAKVAAEAKVVEVTGEFDSFKTGLDELREVASREEARVAKLREVAAHLPDEWYKVEGRLERICAMDDASFETYAADLGSTNTVAPTGSAIPRETAMQQQVVTPPGAPKESAARGFLLRKYEGQETS